MPTRITYNSTQSGVTPDNLKDLVDDLNDGLGDNAEIDMYEVHYASDVEALAIEIMADDVSSSDLESTIDVIDSIVTTMTVPFPSASENVAVEQV